jgi:DNA-binding MarR family transcriptional regulator
MAYRVMQRAPTAQNPLGSGVTPFAIEDNTAFLTALAQRLFTRALQLRFAPHGVSVGQWPLLLYLWQEDGLTQKELSRRVHIEEPTTTRTLGRMERDGLVRRERNPRNRRQVKVYLTERGQALRDELVPFALEVNAIATFGMSEQDKSRINSLLGYIIARLQ